jgi:hypothetical protein
MAIVMLGAVRGALVFRDVDREAHASDVSSEIGEQCFF